MGSEKESSSPQPENKMQIETKTANNKNNFLFKNIPQIFDVTIIYYIPFIKFDNNFTSLCNILNFIE